MSIKINRIARIVCLCVVSSISTYYLLQFFTSNKHKTDTAPYASCIIESCSIRDVLDYANDQQTIVVFDLDNTLVYPKQDLE